MQTIDVTCAVIVDNGSVLVTQRGSGMNRAGKWEFPGGKIKAGETPETCIIREIKEELNVDIYVISSLQPVIHSYLDITIRLIPYVAKISKGLIKLHEHSGYEWAEKEKLLFYDWAAADIPVAEQVMKTI